MNGFKINVSFAADSFNYDPVPALPDQLPPERGDAVEDFAVSDVVEEQTKREGGHPGDYLEDQMEGDNLVN